jgi:hypothetical protein
VLEGFCDCVCILGCHCCNKVLLLRASCPEVLAEKRNKDLVPRPLDGLQQYKRGSTGRAVQAGRYRRDVT